MVDKETFELISKLHILIKLLDERLIVMSDKITNLHERLIKLEKEKQCNIRQDN